MLQHNHYQQLITSITASLEQGRHQAVQQVNSVLVQTYWHIGKHIIEFEQQGNEKAEYGTNLLKQLARDLNVTHGKGFSRSNLQYMRLLYVNYPICQSLSGKLSWSHYTELLSISDGLARSFYEQQCARENWSVRELKRQRDSALFERLALVGGADLTRYGSAITDSPIVARSMVWGGYAGIAYRW